MTPKQRMLAAYRGQASDRAPVAPEFWCYYPAKLLGLDMIEFSRYPFHLALKTAFEQFGCEGWGCVGGGVPKTSAAMTPIPTRMERIIWRNTWRTRIPGGAIRSCV